MDNNLAAELRLGMPLRTLVSSKLLALAVLLTQLRFDNQQK